MTKDVGDCAAIGKSACQQQQPKKRRRIKLFKQDLEPIDGRLIRNPPPKAVAPYTSKSELEDASLRFLIHHCKFPTTQSMRKADILQMSL